MEYMSAEVRGDVENTTVLLVLYSEGGTKSIVLSPHRAQSLGDALQRVSRNVESTAANAFFELIQLDDDDDDGEVEGDD